MAAKLVAEEGDLKGLVLSLENGETWIAGRDPDECQLVIEDPLVSRKHFIARQTAAGIFVENLSTTNPIQVNDEDIDSQPRLLQSGDTLKVANEIFRFYIDEDTHLLDETFQPQITENVTIETELPETDPAANRLPFPESPVLDETEDPQISDTIFDDNDSSFDALADINFGITDTGRWLIKVIGGPNNGAEFYMQAGHSYIIGTDPHTCDIVFQDKSVSRQHAKITVTADDTLLIEDLKSRNGVYVSGEAITERQSLTPSLIVNMGTTSFVVYDREGEMQTIISPLLPSIVKVLQQDDSNNKNQEVTPPVDTYIQETIPESIPQTFNYMPWVIGTTALAFAALAVFGTLALFQDEPVVSQVQENAKEQIDEALAPFPSIRYSYNQSTNSLLLLGHVANSNDKSQLIYNLQGLKFIKAIDDSGIIIDDYVWQEINSVLTRNPAWRGITIHSPEAGQFVLSGYLETRKQAEQLNDYVSLNFPYLDLLKKQVIVEEDVLSQIKVWLQDYGLSKVTAKMSSGEVTLNGSAPADSVSKQEELFEKIKGIPGVRVVNNLIHSEILESGLVNISDHYEVTGQSKLGDRYTVVINGRILSKGDSLDGMLITNVTPSYILLEKDNVKYRIDYNR